MFDFFQYSAGSIFSSTVTAAKEQGFWDKASPSLLGTFIGAVLGLAGQIIKTTWDEKRRDRTQIIRVYRECAGNLITLTNYNLSFFKRGEDTLKKIPDMLEFFTTLLNERSDEKEKMLDDWRQHHFKLMHDIIHSPLEVLQRTWENPVFYDLHIEEFTPITIKNSDIVAIVLNFKSSMEVFRKLLAERESTAQEIVQKLGKNLHDMSKLDDDLATKYTYLLLQVQGLAETLERAITMCYATMVLAEQSYINAYNVKDFEPVIFTKQRLDGIPNPESYQNFFISAGTLKTVKEALKRDYSRVKPPFSKNENQDVI